MYRILNTFYFSSLYKMSKIFHRKSSKQSNSSQSVDNSNDDWTEVPQQPQPQKINFHAKPWPPQAEVRVRGATQDSTHDEESPPNTPSLPRKFPESPLPKPREFAVRHDSPKASPKPARRVTLENNAKQPPKPPRATIPKKEETQEEVTMDSQRWKKLDMGSIVALYNRLLDLSHTTGLSLPNIAFPEIAVIGSQSAGKSSVLESIAGEEFLPRGQDTVTRAPLLLHLVNMRGDEKEKYAVFKDDSGNETKMTDFEQVKQEILNRFGTGKTISDQPISLYLYSPDTVNLTLYDLPGIIRFCDEQDQIEELTESISLEFIKKPTTIILAVTAANSEKQDSAAIKMARRVDPKGLRTLHVITKLDLLGPGEDVTSWLRNEVFPSHHGVVGVVCRSQQEIIDAKPIEEVFKRERKVLERQFPQIASQHGTEVLRHKVNAILMDKLVHCLPKISREIDHQLKESKTEMRKLGPDTQQPTTIIASIVNKFCSIFSRIIEGADEGKATNRTKLVGGALIDQLFKSTFTKGIEQIAFFADLTASEVKVVAKNCAGAAPGMFAENRTFQFLLRPEMDKLLKPSLHVVDEIEQKLDIFVQDVGVSMEFERRRYPVLLQELVELSVDFLSEQWEKTIKMVQTFFEVEKKYFSFSHDDLNTYYRHYYEETERCESHEKHRKSQIQIIYDEIMDSLQGNSEKEILTMLFSYIELTKKMVKDHVPKLIMYHLVDYIKENLQQHLIETLLGGTNEEKMKNLVAEPGPIQQWREETREKLQLLQNAKSAIAAPENLMQR